METRYYNEYSQCLNRDMDFIVYGHTGIPILVFPAQDGHCQDYENFGMVDTIKDKIEQGLVQLFCVGSVDEESYSDEMGNPAHRSYILEQFYYHIWVYEYVPMQHNRTLINLLLPLDYIIHLLLLKHLTQHALLIYYFSDYLFLSRLYLFLQNKNY